MKNLSIITFILSLFNIPTNSVKGIRVAIIGQTFSGALCSHFLHQLIPNNIEIDFYDNDPNVEKHKILTFHSKYHKHLEEILRIKGIKSKNLYPNGYPMMYGGKINLGPWSPGELRAIGRQDHDNLSILITSTFKEFQNIYRLQNEEKQFFTTPNELFKAVNPKFVTYMSTKWDDLVTKLVTKNDSFAFILSKLFLRSYLQFKIHAFAGLSACWFSELNGYESREGYLKRFKGTSYDVVNAIIKKNGDQMKKGIVEVKSEKNNNIIITIDENGKKSEDLYDFVIIAKPNDGKIKFTNFVTDTKNCIYQPVGIVEVQGSLNQECLEKKDSRDVPSVLNSKDVVTILDDKNKNGPIWSILTAREVVKKKMFSEYFENYNCFDITSGKQVDFPTVIRTFVYPNYRNSILHRCTERARFYLGKYLYNANAIDWAASNTEMMAIGAKNIALMIEKVIESSKMI